MMTTNDVNAAAEEAIRTLPKQHVEDYILAAGGFTTPERKQKARAMLRALVAEVEQLRADYADLGVA